MFSTWLATMSPPRSSDRRYINDPILFDYQNVNGEDRWSALGSTDGLRVLVVVFTIREGRIRAVAAFDASKEKAREYWRKKGD